MPRNKSRFKFTGIDRAIKFICTDIRRRCFQYRPEVAEIHKAGICAMCKNTKWMKVEADHIEPVGKRAYKAEELLEYWNRMMYLPMQGLCESHHLEKTARNREEKKNEKRKKV